MKSIDLLDLIGDADDGMVDAAKNHQKRKKNTWRNWCAAAACLCIIFAAIPILSTVLQHQGDVEDPLAAISALEFNGACYEVTDNPEILEKYGLPRTITEEDAGNHISYLEKEGAGYKECVGETTIELYTYVSMPCTGVSVVRDGNEYYAALFCNHILDGSSHVEFSEIYHTYGVEKAADIVSVCEFNGAFDYEEKTNMITSRDALDEFYHASLSLACYGNDDFQAIEIETLPTEEQRTAHYEELAGDATELRIETEAGLVFFVTAYPTYGWLEGDLSYFEFDDTMTEWFSENIR
jgi:hypothetical protein